MENAKFCVPPIVVCLIAGLIANNVCDTFNDPWLWFPAFLLALCGEVIVGIWAWIAYGIIAGK